MFELPEYLTISTQINKTITGKKIKAGYLGNSPHKFVWYNRSHEEFSKLTKDKVIGTSYAKGKWLFIPLEPGYVLVFGESGGKIIYGQNKIPNKYHLLITLENGSFFYAITQMWGAMELYEKGEELKRQYIRDMRPTPVDPEFTYEYFDDLITMICSQEKQSVKGLLTQKQIIPGIGNAIAQDIMLLSRLHPKHLLVDLNKKEKKALYEKIKSTVEKVIEQGGRYDEYDFLGNPGKYIRLLDKNAIKTGCPVCGKKIEKIQYLGGASYLCPKCQK